MPEVRPKNAFTSEPDLLCHPLRRDVVGIGDELEADEPKLVERPTGEQAERARADSLAACRSVRY